jgi:regulator of protease activity HflC (stomatin/prohibitin superfamily)
MNAIFLTLAFVIVLFVYKGIKIVPQQQAWVVEKLGRFDRKLEPGLNFLVPFIERVAYKHSLKEYAHDVMEQTAITRDNVSLTLDGVIYVRIVDPIQASYGVNDPIYAVTQLAQTTMRSEIGKLAMDQSFEERETLNANIVQSINQAAQTWGVQCMRYEIKNISPPANVLKAMDLQMAAERKKRAEILESEGTRQAKINIAEGLKREVELSSEAAKIDQINRAEGEAAAILSIAEATAQGMNMVAQAMMQHGGQEAAALKVAEQYLGAFSKLAQESTTLMLPANAADAGSMIAQAMGVFNTIRRERGAATTTVATPWNTKPTA